MPYVKRSTRELRELESAVQYLRAQVDALLAERDGLHRRNCAAAVAVQHCTALLELQSLLAGRLAIEDSPCSASSISTPAFTPAAALLSIRQHHADSINPELFRENSMALPPLGWCPSKAADAFAAGASELLNTQGLRQELRLSAKRAGLLVQRCQGGAPDSRSAAEQLYEGREWLLHLCALTLICGNLLPLSEALMLPLNVDDEDGPCAAGLAVAPEAPASHWLWAVDQLGLDEAQEEQIHALLEGHAERLQAMQKQIEQLIQQCTGTDDLDEREDHMDSLSAMQGAYQVAQVVCTLCLYGSFIRVEQWARYIVAAYPYTPSVACLTNVLRQRHGEKQAQSTSTTTGEDGSAGVSGSNTGKRWGRPLAAEKAAGAPAAAAHGVGGAGAVGFAGTGTFVFGAGASGDKVS